MGPLSVAKFRELTLDCAPIYLDRGKYELRQWEHLGDTFIGTINRQTGKPEGIVRQINPDGPVWDKQMWDGIRHGYYRAIWKYGTSSSKQFRHGYEFGKQYEYEANGTVSSKYAINADEDKLPL